MKRTQLTSPIVPLRGSIRSLLLTGALTLAVTAITLVPSTFAEDAEPRKPAPSADGEEVKPAPISAAESLKKGVEYLIKQQQPDGGWGQGGGWRQGTGKKGGRVEGKDVEDPSDLGNTAVTVVTLLRAGYSPAAGDQREAMEKAANFICRFVEKADVDSMYVTPVRDTQLQSKIGSYVDTFLTGWALSELKGKMANEDGEKRRADALNKVVKKIEKHQKEDGSFTGNSGWAAVLSQGLCSKALNGAARSGASVSRATLDKDQTQNLAGLDLKTGDFAAAKPATGIGGAAGEPSDAGVSLYREGAKLNGLWENAESNKQRRVAAETVIASPTTSPEQKVEAQSELQKVADDEKAAKVAWKSVAGKLGNQRYVAGFGNNGGEEFLSYLNITESMKAQGGKEWEEWKPKMVATVTGAQNADGSWAGHHCITGRTFCTSTALLTLLVDRAPAVTTTDSKQEPATAAK